MRDQFDARQAYLLLHREQATLAGRQELKYGGERLVGISDWTNNSRTFDGFLGRYGDTNRMDLFTTSWLLFIPRLWDTHRAGLTFHGALGTIQTWVPRGASALCVCEGASASSAGRRCWNRNEVTPGAKW